MTGGIQTFLYQHVLPGKRVLLAGTGPLQLIVAKKLLDAGAQVVGVLEGSGKLVATGMKRAFAMWGQWERMREGAESIVTMTRRGVAYRMGWGLVAAHGTDQVEGATIARLDEQWRPIPGTEQKVACDTIGIEYGLTPFNTLGKIMGAEQVWRANLGGEVPVRDERMETSVPRLYAVGDGAGLGGIQVSLLEGEIAGIAAASAVGGDKARCEADMARVTRKLVHQRRFQRLYAELFTPGPGVWELATDDTMVCRCEGVTLGKVRETLALGATSIPEIKRMTRCGMGECQGRTCCHQVVHVLARECGVSPEAIGGFDARPPLFPLPVVTLAQAAD
jgi:bacterioferritin-associated ferredoxin